MTRDALSSIGSALATLALAWKPMRFVTAHDARAAPLPHAERDWQGDAEPNTARG